MAKRTTNERDSRRVKVPEVLEEELTPKTVRIVSLRTSKVNVTGKTTGKLYVFNGAGSMVDVDEQDAQEILSKRAGKSCCGPGRTPFFQLAEV